MLTEPSGLRPSQDAILQRLRDPCFEHRPVREAPRFSRGGIAPHACQTMPHGQRDDPRQDELAAVLQLPPRQAPHLVNQLSGQRALDAAMCVQRSEGVILLALSSSRLATPQTRPR